MLHALTSRFRRRVPSAQLELGFDRPAPRDADELLACLQTLGLRRVPKVVLTRNRNVIVSHGPRALRVHEGFLTASEPVLRAIVSFVEGARLAERRAAREVIVTHQVARTEPREPRRREQTHPDDVALAERLTVRHREYNDRYFGGTLQPVAIRVSRRMKSRLGHYSAASGEGGAAEIAMSRRHLRRHGWDETLHTLLHEMVHQWQDEAGHPIDHGALFRAKARAVGVAPAARRRVG